jgi:high affinity Mn2+ porin
MHRADGGRSGIRVFAILAGLVALAWVLIPGPSQAQMPLPVPVEDWSLHGQVTGIVQYHPSFRWSYQGANSLDPGNSGRETVDLTLYAGLRLWQGGQLFANPEIDQGFGLSNTLGVAGFPSGEAYKVGASDPYFRLPRLFLRQTFALGPDVETVGRGANQLAGAQPVDSLVVTCGKFSVVDLFDTNRYAHDPRADFMNWAVIDAGAFDYAADAWGYSYGAAVEWNPSNWTARLGAFALSRVPNSRELDRGFGQFALIGELERRHAWDGHPGKLKLLGFVNHGLMGRYDDALAQSRTTAAIADTSLVRQTLSRPGFALNFEQELGADLGVFARASINDGSKEAFEFTEINRSISLGLSLNGHRWSRAQDAVGLALVVNGLSSAARDYFEAGGLGILIGDGALRYGAEKIAETYYALRVAPHWTVTANYQYIDHPAYNRDRGPVSVLGARLHMDY